MSDFKYGEITEKIIGAAFRVHGTLGNGFQEVIYQRAMEMEFHRFTNEKYNSKIIQHPNIPINPTNPSSDK